MCPSKIELFGPPWEVPARRSDAEGPGTPIGPGLFVLFIASAGGRLLCHGSNSGKVPLYRTTILTPHRLECASRSSAVCGWPLAVARPGLLGTPGLVLL